MRRNTSESGTSGKSRNPLGKSDTHSTYSLFHGTGFWTFSTSGIKSFLFLSALAVLLGSCVNLRHVNEFSATSVESIGQYEKIPVNFSEICLQDCRQEHIRNYEIQTTDCDCTQNQKADSITRIMYEAARDYFQGLSEISQNELTEYRTDDFTQALTSGNFGPLKLNESDVKAYSDISTLLMRAFTDGFRRKKIKEYVAQAHGPLLKLLEFLELNLAGNLHGKLEVQKGSLKNFYFDFIKDKNLSDYERTKFAEDYFHKVSEIEAHQQELDAYAKVLGEIGDGHTALYNNVSNMTDDEVRRELGRYSNQLSRTASSIQRR
ncbi:MAG: hypothetical protein WA913_15080 [Pricia sp.]